MPNTREKLIELIKESLRAMGGVCNDNICKHCKYEKYNDDCGTAIRADHLIANGVTVQKWIPVTERLPELWQTVIVCDTREQYVGACMYYGNDDWLHDDKLWDTSEITHWMPLPEPPKGE